MKQLQQFWKKIKLIFTFIEHRIIFKFFDFVEWDVQNAGIIIFIGIGLAVGAVDLKVSQWQYWLFLISSNVVMVSVYIKGVFKGQNFQRKRHDEHFLCIPKEVIIQQAKLQEDIHRVMHDHEPKKDKKEPN